MRMVVTYASLYYILHIYISLVLLDDSNASTLGLSVLIKGLIKVITNSETCSFGGVTDLVSELGLIFLDEL